MYIGTYICIYIYIIFGGNCGEGPMVVLGTRIRASAATVVDRMDPKTGTYLGIHRQRGSDQAGSRVALELWAPSLCILQCTVHT